jgi:kumamolisin
LLLGALAALASIAPATGATAATPPTRLGWDIRAAIARSTRLGPAASADRMTVQVALKLRDQAALEDLVMRVSAPGSPEYGHYLTNQQFRDRFGPTATTVAATAGYLQAQGLAIVGSAPGSTLVNAEGTVAQVEQAVHTSISRYHDPVADRDYFANDDAPALPPTIASAVQAVHGLDNHAVRHRSAAPCPTCANAPYTPAQVRAGYNFTSAPLAGLTGGGQSVGLLELATFQQANISHFDQAYGISPPTPVKMTVPGGSPPTYNGGEVEADLDIEVVQGIAPGATVMVFEAGNFTGALNNAYHCMMDETSLGSDVLTRCPNFATGTSPSNSTSWGLCEPDQGSGEATTLHNIFAGGAATGHSMFAASGDLGSTDGCSHPGLAVDSPASDPFVTGTGGSKLLLNQADNTWRDETAWTVLPGSQLGAGGGLSIFFSRPSWQLGTGVANQFSNGFRQVPDVGLNSDPKTGFSIYTCADSSNANSCDPSATSPPQTGLFGIGGTSAAAPGWAAFTAIYNQYAASHARPSLGFANPALYDVAACPQGLAPYHDITQGSNANNSPFTTTAGWDYLTGIGSYNAAGMVSALAGLGSAALAVSSVAPATGTSGDQVLVNGCGFATSGGSQPAVTFGGAAATTVAVLDPTHLQATVPAHTLGTVPVTVTNPAGAGGASATLAIAYAYQVGGYLMDGYGGVHDFGATPPVSDSSHAYWPGWQIARALATCPDNSHRGVTLDGYGGVHGFGGLPDPGLSAYWSGWDIARGVALTGCSSGARGWVVDGYGGLHGFGGQPPTVPDSHGQYWPGWDIAIGVAACPDVPGSGYVLDGYGGVHNFGGAPPLNDAGHAYWAGWRIARGLAVAQCSGSGAGYTLDGYGGIHGFGAAPAAPSTQPGAYWSGWDIARGIDVLADGSGGHYLDGYGGIHGFGSQAFITPPPTHGAYWPGWDIARGIGGSS